MSDNPLDEKWLDWFSGCYRTNAAQMSDQQREQLEAAFYAGAACGSNVARERGHPIVENAVAAHVARIQRAHGPRQS